jgi:hypothetical protein
MSQILDKCRSTPNSSISILMIQESRMSLLIHAIIVPRTKWCHCKENRFGREYFTQFQTVLNVEFDAPGRCGGLLHNQNLNTYVPSAPTPDGNAIRTAHNALSLRTCIRERCAIGVFGRCSPISRTTACMIGHLLFWRRQILGRPMRVVNQMVQEVNVLLTSLPCSQSCSHTGRLAFA